MVRWGNHYSERFHVCNGVRQGGILSPYLFNVYMNELSEKLQHSKTGCTINSVWINHLFYADDSVLLAPSPHALQTLLNICTSFANLCELTYNTKKTFCVCIKPRSIRKLFVPDIKLSGSTLKFVNEHKYLGVQLGEDFKDDNDMKRQIKSVYARGNVLLKRFKNCSNEVKVKLFNSFCGNFYCSNLWSTFNRTTAQKVQSAYNRIYRNLMGITDWQLTKMSMVSYGVKTYNEIQRKLVYSLHKRVNESANTMIIAIINSVFFYGSKLNHEWQRVLFKR